MMRRNLILLAAVVVIGVLPLVLPLGGAAPAFRGSDDEGTDAIATLAPGYRPWVRPLWTPPGDEVESLLFSLQAALGAGLIGYYIGLRRGRQRREDEAGAGD